MENEWLTLLIIIINIFNTYDLKSHNEGTEMDQIG